MQRVFSTVIPWATLFGVCCRHPRYRATAVARLAGDAVVVTKAGQHTHGLDRFFASLYGKPVAGLACGRLSLVSLPERGSFPMHVEQVVRSPAAQTASRLRQKPRSGHHPSPNAALGLRRGVRPAKQTWPSPPSYGRFVPGATPSSTGSPGLAP